MSINLINTTTPNTDSDVRAIATVDVQKVVNLLKKRVPEAYVRSSVHNAPRTASTHSDQHVQEAIEALTTASRGRQARSVARLIAARWEAVISAEARMAPVSVKLCGVKNVTEGVRRYMATFEKAYSEHAFTIGGFAGAVQKASGEAGMLASEEFSLAVHRGGPITHDGLAQLGVAIAFAAWTELGPDAQAEYFCMRGVSDAPRDTKVLMGIESYRVGNFYPNAAQEAEWWAFATRGRSMTAAIKVYEEEAKGGFGLKDVNPFFYNCGHYPEWKVVRGGEFRTRLEATAVAARKNQRTQEGWSAHIS